MKKQASIILLIMALVAAPLVPASAEPTIITYTIPVTYELEQQNVTIDGTGPVDVNFTLLYPNPQDVFLAYDFTNVTDTTFGIDIKILDTNGTQLQLISLSSGEALSAIVPLSSVPEEFTVQVTNTTNLASNVWTGSVKVIVHDQVKLDVSGLQDINVQAGKPASLSFTVKQISGPAGSITWTVSFKDPSGRYTSRINYQMSPSFVSTTGAGWSGQETFTVTPSSYASSGTYTGTIKAWFTSSVKTPMGQPLVDNAEVVNIELGIGIDSGIAGDIISKASGHPWYYYAVAAVIILSAVVLIAKEL